MRYLFISSEDCLSSAYYIIRLWNGELFNSHPMTSPIAREAAERIAHHGKYGNDLAIITPIIESALQSHLAQAIKESGVEKALETTITGFDKLPEFHEARYAGSLNINGLRAALLRLRALSGEAK